MLLVVVAIAGAVLLSSRSDRPATNVPVVGAVEPKPKPQPRVGVGELGKLGYPGGGGHSVWVALDESAWNDMIDALNAQSLGALSRLAEKGKVKAYAVGTNVRVVRSGFASRKIIVTDGDDAGDMGWVQFEFVLPR
jgi:hypothetical protein